jgi:hypothetical protein
MIPNLTVAQPLEPIPTVSVAEGFTLSGATAGHPLRGANDGGQSVGGVVES